MFHLVGIFASMVLLSSVVATTFQIQYSGAQTLVPVSKEFQTPDIQLNKSFVKGDDRSEPQAEEEEPAIKGENETTSQENDTGSEEQPIATTPRKKVEGGLDLDTPGLQSLYKIKVTFNSITIHNDREGAASGNGEFDLSAFVQGKRVDLTEGSPVSTCTRLVPGLVGRFGPTYFPQNYPCKALLNAEEGRTYQFVPGTEVTVPLFATVPLSIFTVGNEVDDVGRVDWPGVDDPVMQKLVTTLNEPSAPGSADPPDSVKSKAIGAFKGLIHDLGLDLDVQNDDDPVEGTRIYYDATEYGAGSHAEEDSRGDFTLRYTITITPPQPPTIKPDASSGTCNNNLPVSGVTSSASRSTFPPTNAIDNNFNTKWWSTFIVKPFITLNLGGLKSICSVDIAWADGSLHPYLFDVSVSTDGTTFTNVLSGTSTGTTTSPEKYNFPQTQARYVKITITQSMAGSANSIAQISEIDIFG